MMDDITGVKSAVKENKAPAEKPKNKETKPAAKKSEKSKKTV